MADFKVGYNFQDRMLDLTRDLSAAKCQNVALISKLYIFNLSFFTYFITSIMEKAFGRSLITSGSMCFLFQFQSNNYQSADQAYLVS